MQTTKNTHYPKKGYAFLGETRDTGALQFHSEPETRIADSQGDGRLAAWRTRRADRALYRLPHREGDAEQMLAGVMANLGQELEEI